MIRNALSRYRFWLILALLFASQVAIVGAFFLAIRVDLDAAQRTLLDQFLAQRAALMALLALMLLMAQALALKFLIDRYLAPMARLAEEAILLTSNPAHRIVPEGAHEVRELAAKLNTVAATLQQLHGDVQARVDNANRALGEEKNRLAALMSEIAQSVLVCNIEGTILLYNTHARHLLGSGHGSAGETATLGLGRSLFGILERDLIVHALEQIQYQLQHRAGAASPVSRFVTALADGKIVRAHMAPVPDGAQSLHGFVLTLEDITRTVEADNRRDGLRQFLAEDVRSALAHIRAAADALERDAGTDDARRHAAAIAGESRRLESRIDCAERQHADDQDGEWHLEEMRARDLLALLQRRIGNTSVPADALSDADAALWLKVDSFRLTKTLAHLAHRLVHERGVGELQLRLMRSGRMADLDLCWSGSELPADVLRAWETEPLDRATDKAALTLASAVSARGRVATYRFDPSCAMSRYRVPLRLAKPRAPLEHVLRKPGRPEFYDFDLFHQAGQNAAIDERLLTRISYTVFDTETTGLHPAAGDEIIAIGALRIVNGRLLAHESFDQLVQPGMLLNPESTAIHGIDNAMLKGRPAIEKVLPRFHRFAEDTVLIAHNAAFDMKFLQMKEEKTGIRFSQPVLDTLLLSQVLHPSQKDHSLEAIAQRFGVDIVGRHTALGDALVTGEVFLKMIPLLAEKGIHTLGQARAAEQQTPYARIRYE